MTEQIQATQQAEATTTLALYVSDLAWFRKWQLNVSDHTGKWLNMPDSVRALTRRIDALEEESA